MHMMMNRGPRILHRCSAALLALVVFLLVGARIGPWAPDARAQDLRAKNVILLIPDGMGEALVLATRYWRVGRDGQLEMDRLPVFGLVTTHAENSLVTDSAAAGTALATGTRTNNRALAQTPAGASTLDRSILMLAKRAGKSAGLVTEVQITHATPAPFAASVRDRGMMNEIAEQYLANRVDVLLGGGESNFRAAGAPGVHCTADATKRGGRDLMAEVAAAGYQVITGRAALLAAPAPRGRLIGLFACEHMAWATKPVATEPTSAEKTRKAIEILARNPNGFFLMVERGKIDWAVEANNAEESLAETLEFDKAVGVAMEFARADGNTLVIVVADHEAGGLHIISRPDRGPVEAAGLVDDRGRTRTPRRGATFKSADGLDIHLAWATHPGHTAHPVGVRAYGPGSDIVRGFTGRQHLTDVYEVMRRAFFGSAR
jgi:alkaline phosphatase